MNCHINHWYSLVASLSPSSPINLTSPSQSPTSITLSWEQPAGDAVDRYDIVYTYQGECSGYTQPENVATVNVGTAALQNLQEFTNYTVTIAAVNDAGQSMQFNLTVPTLAAGMYTYLHAESIASFIKFVLPFSSQWSS